MSARAARRVKVRKVIAWHHPGSLGRPRYAWLDECTCVPADVWERVLQKCNMVASGTGTRFYVASSGPDSPVLRSVLSSSRGSSIPSEAAEAARAQEASPQAGEPHTETPAR